MELFLFYFIIFHFLFKEMIYLTKDVKDIHIENCKELTKETENNTKKIENDMKISLAIELEELISLK